jgi:aerobic carbon-monoxide dehydrogenase large subunit
MSELGIGASARRKEDYRFLTGKGLYVDDIVRPGQLHAYILRSPFAHARIVSIDTTAAKESPGVVAVYTGADLEAAGVGGIPCGWQITNKDGSKMTEPAHPALAVGKVRHVGDQVALVVAETKEQARAAGLAIAVEYEELPAVISMPAAIAADAPRVHDDIPANTCFDWAIGDAAATDAAFARAAHVTRLDLINNRLIPNAMEPRAAIGEFDRGTGDTTLWTTSQNPHVIRLLMAAFVLKIPEHKLRVVAPDVGGGFGSKIFHYAEEALVTFAARHLARPVKWTAERSESFMSDAHGRDHVTHAELALDEGGKFIGLRVSTLANMGAYLSTFAPAIPTWLHGTLMSGCYTTPAIYCEVRAVFTNTVAVDAYRGAGRPEATYVLERLVDTAARELGIDPAELRRRNFIPKEGFPYATPVGLTYDTGDYNPTLDMALEKADYAGFAGRRDEARSRGKLRGIGLATYVEACGIAPSALVGALGARAALYESGQIRVHPTGSVTVFTGTHSHGQGHETTFAQVVSDLLGVPFDQVEVVHGDTSKIAFGMGTYGSRSIAVGGSALAKAADKIIAKGKKIAAHLLEAAETDIEFKDGRFTVAGTDRAKTIGEVAFAAYVPHSYPIESVEPGLEETAFYDPKNFTYPAGCHVAEVEIDPETGAVEVKRFTVTDDVGRVINPMIVDGQIHGGVAQGIGQALLEGCVYDPDSGQLMTGSFMSYQMPRAADVPFFDVGIHATDCTHNPLGVKGVGEVGSIGAPAAVINAVVDALAHLGIKHLDMPATSERVWRAIRDASGTKEERRS